MTLLDRILCRPCIFCEIVGGSTSAELIYKATETHILIVPVAHIQTVKTLTPTTEHISLLEKMRLKGMDLLRERGHDPEESKMGFHVPPFNTVDHLHLHVLGGAYKSRLRKLKYETGRMWYMDLTQLQADLERKRRLQEGARL
ncbi:hypothetical protein BG011_007647 [Mortierella polycephala]|uniref:HIT domain-containing protein n=1 Tax=Mortierella polycephala TaxID=41804 RepID=A0A9P6QJI7_9FUNG|nr:hypothetical protein BG011_007647 [Mortierella polycephala]